MKKKVLSIFAVILIALSCFTPTNVFASETPIDEYINFEVPTSRISSNGNFTFNVHRSLKSGSFTANGTSITIQTRARIYHLGYDPDAVASHSFNYTVSSETRSNKYVLGKTYSTIDSTLQSDINKMDSRYGKLEDEVGDTIDKKLARAKTKVNMQELVAGGKLFGYDAAARSLERYLDNTGANLDHSDIQNLLDLSQDSQQIYNNLLLNATKATELMMPNQDGTITFSLDYEDTGRCTREDSVDWYASIGKYRIEVICNARKIGNTYQLTFNYALKDYYDWIEGGTDVFEFEKGPAKISIVEDEGFQLHYAGEAKAFNQGGTITNNYTWTKGNSQSVI